MLPGFQVVRPGSAALVDPYLKTARAKVHVEDLRQRLAIFSAEPCQFSRHDDLENGWHVITMKIKDIPDEIPLIAGDLFYCLRASLDQLVWCLAKINATPGYPKGTAFPILEKKDSPLFRRRTAGLPAEAAKMIESLQPYNAPTPERAREHLLWRLNKLCNIDKHIRIPVHGVTGLIKWDTMAEFHWKDFVFAEVDGCAVMKIPLSLKDQVALNPRVPEFKVVFGDLFWKIECDFEGIEAIYEFVANKVIPRFARFFQQSASLTARA